MMEWEIVNFVALVENKHGRWIRISQILDGFVLRRSLGNIHNHRNCFEKNAKNSPAMRCGLAHPRTQIHPQFVNSCVNKGCWQIRAVFQREMVENRSGSVLSWDYTNCGWILLSMSEATHHDWGVYLHSISENISMLMRVLKAHPKKEVNLQMVKSRVR